MLKLTMEAASSALTGVFLFTVWWCWYYLTDGWRWYSLRSTRDHETFFPWRYRVKVALIFVVVFVAVRKLGHP